MAGPLIPYIEAPELPLSFLEYIPILGNYINSADPPSIKPFGTLVAIGVYIGSLITMARVKERGLDGKQVSDFIFWTVASGFVLSHLFDAITYHPDTVMKDPLYLFKVWDGLSSYGGFMGAVVGSVSWKLYRKKRVLEYMDITVSAFPTAWVFGRSGCATVHDHPGMLSNAWYAVQYPAHTLQAGFDGRIDLGLVEMVLTIPLAVACHILWRRNPYRANGFYIGLTLTAYAPVRFLLDFLRVQPDDLVFRGAVDLRYAGLTPAQWVCFLALGVGLFFVKKTWNAPYERIGDLEEDEPLDDRDSLSDDDGLSDDDSVGDDESLTDGDDSLSDDDDLADETSDDDEEGAPAARKKRSKGGAAKGGATSTKASGTAPSKKAKPSPSKKKAGAGDPARAKATASADAGTKRRGKKSKGRKKRADA